MKDRMKKFYRTHCGFCGSPVRVPKTYQGSNPMHPWCREEVERLALLNRVTAAAKHAPRPRARQRDTFSLGVILNGKTQ